MYKKFSKVFSFLLSITMLVSTAVINANAGNIAFTDVPASHWAYSYVTTCANNGWVSGVGNNKFMPDGKLTNAQFVTMVANGVYRDMKSDYEDENWMEMDAYFNGNPKWWSYNAYFAKDHGFLNGTAFYDIKKAATADAPMTRYDMAQVLYNCLIFEGISATSAQKSAAQASIKDWNQIPTQYRDAVSTCFAIGLLSGLGDGSFGGSQTMTRAQACVVMVRLDETIANGPTIKEPDVTPVEPEKPSVTPEQPSTTTQDIAVTTKSTTYGTGYYVADNGFGTGKLNNGKAITEANVKELLAKAESIWPNGTTWTYSGTKNNHWYQSSGSVVDKAILHQYNTSTNYACGGFAAMISDYLFGKDGNPAYRVTNSKDARPGDILVQMVNGKEDHVAIIAYADNGAIITADGNCNGKISWPYIQYDTPVTEELVRTVNPSISWEIWSRYPA